MIYSDFQIDSISSPLYEQLSQKLLELTEDEETKRKMKRNIV